MLHAEILTPGNFRFFFFTSGCLQAASHSQRHIQLTSPLFVLAQKFIITAQGHFRLGDVRLHKHLLEPGDTCYGGGFYQIDHLSNRLLLDGASYDYGRPLWDRLIYRQTPLKVPEAYRGMQIVYHPEDQFADDLVITHELPIEYV